VVKINAKKRRLRQIPVSQAEEAVYPAKADQPVLYHPQPRSAGGALLPIRHYYWRLQFKYKVSDGMIGPDYLMRSERCNFRREIFPAIGRLLSFLKSVN
jgi:hypothetical protein